MSINRVVLCGNLTRDPEIRTTQSGMTVMSFGIAVNDRRKNTQTGEWEDVPNFIDCTMFGNWAQSVSQYISKGSKVVLEGKLHWSQWESNGQKRSKVDVIIDDINFMSQSSSASSSQSYSKPISHSRSSQTYTNTPQDPYGYSNPYTAPTTPVIDTTRSVYDEDIPF